MTRVDRKLECKHFRSDSVDYIFIVAGILGENGEQQNSMADMSIDVVSKKW